MGTAVVRALKREYGDVKVVHFEGLVKQVMPESEKFPLDSLYDLSTVAEFFPDASLAVINKFRKDNDGQLSFFCALDDSMLEHVRERRAAHTAGVFRLLGRTPGTSLDEINSLSILNAMNAETNYFADWQRYGFDVGYDDVHLDHPEEDVGSVSTLGDFAIVHDSRLPGRSGISPYVMKAWYPQRWSLLCRKLSEIMPVVQIVGRDQQCWKNAIPHTEIIGESAVFKDYLNLLRHSRLYVGTDSWPAHAAICVRKPKYVILKGAVSRRWDHDGVYSKILRTGLCQACEGPAGANSSCLWRNGTHECMDAITVEMVYNTAKEELA